MELKQIEYHRNGTFGTGFYAILFSDDGNNFIASVFPGRNCVSVICLDLLPDHGVTVGSNYWPSDRFEAYFKMWIRKMGQA